MEENDPADLIDWVYLQKILEAVDKQGDPPRIGKSTLKKKSDLYPAPSTHPNAAAFLKLVNRDLEKLRITNKNPMNLSENELSALKRLSDNSSITIKASDKGENVVILDNEQYLDMCNQILKNSNWLSSYAE